MGEMADYYIERQLNRHMNPERELSRIMRENHRENQLRMEAMDDKTLMEQAEKAIQDKKCNSKFITVAKKILETKPAKLSEKQRNCFYGLLGNSM
jgi:hypothetical protein